MNNNTTNPNHLRTGLAGLGIGTTAIVAALTLAPTLASAQGDIEPETTGADEATPRQSRSDVLDELVTEGVITQDQADAIAERFATARADGRGRHGGRGGIRGAGSEAVSELLGLSSEEIRAAVRDGQTLAEVAEAQGVSTGALVDAIVAEATTAVEAKLAAGDISAERAESKLDGLAERVEDRVTTVGPQRRSR